MHLGTAYNVEDLYLVEDLPSGVELSGFGAEGNRTVGYRMSIPAPNLQHAIDAIRSSEAFRCGDLLFLFPDDGDLLEAERQGFDGFLKWRHECYEKRHGDSPYPIRNSW